MFKNIKLNVPNVFALGCVLGAIIVAPNPISIVFLFVGFISLLIGDIAS